MLRLGARLSLRSGREALVRLLLTMAAVAAGVAVLLSVFAEFNAFENTNKRPAWENSQGVPAARLSTLPRSQTSDSELWYYSNDFYQGRTIERLDVAPLGDGAPVPLGVDRIPAPGQYFVSPALATLLKSVPPQQLGDRFPGTEAGTIGDAALTGPSELVVYVGYEPGQLSSLSNALVVDQLANGPQTSVWTNYFRYAFGVGALAFLFPILILIGTATRLAAARREERFAALRLVGATSRQIGVIAAVDAFLGAALGSVLGIGLYLATQPVLADFAIIGAKYFPYLITPTVWGYVGVLVAVPLLSTLAAVVSLRRVRISPLGVSRRTAPPPPRAWRIAPLVAGIVLFIVGLATTTKASIGAAMYPGLIVILIGLVVGGPWFTVQAAKLLNRLRGTASSLLAARRLTDNPRAAFRSVSGLVLAVFLGTLLAGLMPALNTYTATPNANQLQNVLIDSFAQNCLNSCAGNTDPARLTLQQFEQQIEQTDGMGSQASVTLLQELRTQFPTAAVLPIYNPSISEVVQARQQNQGPFLPPTLVPCAALTQFPTLGTCAAGVQAIATDTSGLTMSDNPLYSTKPIVTESAKPTGDDFTGLGLNAILVKSADPAQLEQIRTFLSTHTNASESATAPQTFGEQVQTRLNVSNIAQRMIFIAVVLTILVAGCSLAVAVGGGLVERKRPFGLLRLTGTSTGTLYRVVLFESVLPLVTATVIAAGLAYGLAFLTVLKMAPAGAPLPTFGGSYFATVGGGLVGSVLVILTVLPVLGRITSSENARFE